MAEGSGKLPRRKLSPDQRDERLERGKKQREQTRRKLIDAAYELFAARGNEPPSIDEIVLRAGVGRGSFYNHFASREDLFEAVANDIGSEIQVMIEPGLSSIEDPAERICVAFRRFVRHLVAQPSRALMFLRIAPFVHEISNAAESYSDAVFQAGMEAGRFRRQDESLWHDLTTGLTLAAVRRVVITRGPVESIDRLAANLLVALGIAPDEADDIAARPLDPAAG